MTFRSCKLLGYKTTTVSIVSAVLDVLVEYSCDITLWVHAIGVSHPASNT